MQLNRDWPAIVNKAEYIALVIMYQRKVDAVLPVASWMARTGSVSDRDLLVLWDNSPSEIDARSKDHLAHNGILYIHSPDNPKLSSIYNILLSTANENAVLGIFDHDSQLKDSYWSSVRHWRATKSSDAVWLPSVVSSGVLVSPGFNAGYKGKLRRHVRVGSQDSGGLLAITSGIAICIRQIRYANIEFDEKLHFYGIDTKFLMDLSRQRMTIFVSEEAVCHDTALRSSGAVEMQWRLWELEFAWKYILKEDRLNLTKFHLHKYIRRLVTALRTRSYLPLHPKQRLKQASINSVRDSE